MLGLGRTLYLLELILETLSLGNGVLPLMVMLSYGLCNGVLPLTVK